MCLQYWRSRHRPDKRRLPTWRGGYVAVVLIDASQPLTEQDLRITTMVIEAGRALEKLVPDQGLHAAARKARQGLSQVWCQERPARPPVPPRRPPLPRPITRTALPAGTAVRSMTAPALPPAESRRGRPSTPVPSGSSHQPGAASLSCAGGLCAR
jgi:hypothetical protein